MQGKDLLFKDCGREKLLEGMKIAFEMVKHTFGGYGGHTLVEQLHAPPISISSGYLALADFSLKDPLLNTGIHFAKECAQKMEEECKEGTTLVVILLYRLLRNLFRLIQNDHDPILLKASLEEGLFTVLHRLESLKIDMPEEKVISSLITGNKELSPILLEAFHKAGKKGSIVVDVSETGSTYVELKKGLSLKGSLSSPYFTTNSTHDEAKFENGSILVTDSFIASPEEILPLLQQFAETKEPLLIAAGGISSELLSTLTLNKLKGILNVAVVKLEQKELLETLASYTGATFISSDRGLSLQDATSKDLGKAKTIIADKNTLSFIEGSGSLETESVAVIYAGGATDFATKQIKKEVEASIRTIKSALLEGTLPGGGSALFWASQILSDTNAAHKALKEALAFPLSLIIENGGNESSLILEELTKKEPPYGWNTETKKIENFQVSCILDPFKVVSYALQVVVSTANVLSLSEVIISHKC